MTFGRHLKCNSCGKTETIRTALFYHYQLDTDCILPMVSIPIWCFECDSIRDGEQLPELDRLADLVDELKTNGLNELELKEKASFLQIEIDPHLEYEQEIARRLAAQAWRKERRSPPRCIECGGVNHQPVNWSDEGSDHPNCGGTFVSLQTWHASQGTYRVLDPEGNRLPDESK